MNTVKLFRVRLACGQAKNCVKRVGGYREGGVSLQPKFNSSPS